MSDELEDVIVDYAKDYDRSEWLRDTKWADVEKALTAHDEQVRADAIEHPTQGTIKRIADRAYSDGMAAERERCKEIALDYAGGPSSDALRIAVAIEAVPAEQKESN